MFKFRETFKTSETLEARRAEKWRRFEENFEWDCDPATIEIELDELDKPIFFEGLSEVEKMLTDDSTEMYKQDDSI